ncbi:unnamed protein product [Rotaria sp. Silwood1]|nr:unnamed protein product [Rotaria sp. Silwood1]
MHTFYALIDDTSESNLLTTSSDVFQSNTPYSNETGSHLNNIDATISTETVTTTSTSTTTVTTTSTSTTNGGTRNSEIPITMDITSMSPNNITEFIPSSEKPNLGLILGLSLGLGLPFLICITVAIVCFRKKLISIWLKCVSPYVQAPSGNCINILIDINNCGKINNVCPSTYTSCSAGLCSTLSSIKIINGTFIWAASVNGSVDDKYFTITVPFNITLYNTTTTSITVTTNGVICLQTCSTTFTETALPTSAFSGATILPYWDDLYIYANTSQGIYYQKQGNAPNQTFIVEYYCSHYQQSTDYYNFQVIFFENMPGVVQFIYYEVTDEGASSTVGVQDSSSGPFVQYSFDQASSVTQNMTLIFDTNTGTYTSSSIG